MAVQERFDLVVRARDEASVVLNRIQKNVLFLADGTVHKFDAVTKSTTGMAASFTRADLRSAALGTRLAGLPPILNNVMGAFAFGSPIVAGLSFGIGLLTQAIFESNDGMEEYAKTLSVTNEQLAKLAESAGAAGASAEFLKNQRLALLRTEEQSLQVQIAGIDTTKTISSEYDRLGGITGEQTRVWTEQRIKADNLKSKLEELTARLAMNREEQGKLTTEDVKAADATSKLAAETEKLMRVLSQREQLMRSLNQANFRGMGSDASLRGPGFFGAPKEDVDKAREEADRALDRIIAIPEEEARALADAQAQWQEFSGVVLSSTDQLATGITDMFFGLRDSLADVFKSMAMNWVKYFINEILKQTALRLGFQLLNVIFPGAGGVLSGAGASDVGILPGLAKAGSGTGIDLASAGAKRFAGPTSAGAPVVVNINGPILGEEDHVQKKVIPVIERAIRYQTTTIAGR